MTGADQNPDGPERAGESSAGAPHEGGLGGLEALLKAQGSGQSPPVDKWNPPYCGDIGMAIRRDGLWTYQGSPIGRKPLVKLFSSVLRKDEDGRHYLVTPVEMVDVTVADAPFLGVEMEVSGTGAGQQLIFRTNVDDIVRCGPDHPLRFEAEPGSGGLKPYLRVRGRLEALITRAVYYDLVELAVTTTVAGRDVFGVWSGGQLWELTGTEPAGG
jgi:uncharacterized protein